MIKSAWSFETLSTFILVAACYSADNKVVIVGHALRATRCKQDKKVMQLTPELQTPEAKACLC